MVMVERTGVRYGRLTALRPVKKEGKKAMYWECLCDCGKTNIVRGASLGVNAFSCGCLKKEQDKKNLNRVKHGKSKERIWKLWRHMIYRCYQEKATGYENYGGRGITVCDEWKNDYNSFEKWALINGYEEGLTLDRIDVNGNYEPKNCRWLTMTEQKKNTQKTLFVELNGELTSLRNAYYQSKPNVSYQTAKTRYHKGERDLSKLFAPRSIPR